MQRVGTIVLVLFVAAIVIVQGVSIVLNWAADDVRLEFGYIHGRDRTPVGMWLSSVLMSDLD
ncbi:MAG: hypothetical protein JOY61_00285, partial [Chloroflexi bacterium]|nr:hypothetical protein [Chloroflexota bacterium]